MIENFFGITDPGRLRDNNEDAFIAKKTNNLIVACVIDGVGGYEGGEIAASLAKEAIVNTLRHPVEEKEQLLRTAFINANEKIYNEKQKNNQYAEMACVLTVALVDTKNNQFYYAHVGDTRLYLLRDRTLVKVTKDHSFVGFLEDSGKLSEAEAMAHPKRNEINKALGFSPNIELQPDYIETGHSPFLPGDALLLCSDGLTDMIDNKTITQILTSEQTLKTKGKALIEAANKAGGKDNITVVIVQNDHKPVQQKPTKPIVPIKKNETVQEETVTELPLQPTKQKNYRTAAIVLGIICALLIIALLWQLLSKQSIVRQSINVEERNITEQKLQDSLVYNTGYFLLSDSVFGKEIVITDTIHIQKDSFHINGHGIVLTAGSSYNGPAFIITPGAKQAVFEDVILKNFRTGIITHDTTLDLRNVQFLNCPVHIQYNFRVSEGHDTNRIKTDTIRKTDSILKQ